jgi:hypothetical protein
MLYPAKEKHRLQMLRTFHHIIIVYGFFNHIKSWPGSGFFSITPSINAEKGFCFPGKVSAPAKRAF